MTILASDFSGLVWMILAIPLSLLFLSAVSFFPACYGHWAAPALALPAVVLGILFDSAVMFGGASHMAPWVCMMFLAPPVVGILAMGLWSEKRKKRDV